MIKYSQKPISQSEKESELARTRLRNLRFISNSREIERARAHQMEQLGLIIQSPSEGSKDSIMFSPHLEERQLEYGFQSPIGGFNNPLMFSPWEELRRDDFSMHSLKEPLLFSPGNPFL